MSKNANRIPLLRLFFCLWTLQSSHAATQNEFSLANYLQEVRSQNTGIQGSLQAAQGAQERSTDASTLLAPTLTATIQLAGDSSLATSMFPRDKTVSNTYNLGLSQTTRAGLTARLNYSVNYTSLIGLSPQLTPLVAYTVFHDAKPSLELSQALWRNGFGSEVQATQEASEAAALGASYAENYKVKLLLAEAEMTYWRLVVARDAIAIHRENLERSLKLRNWAHTRYERQLADRADLLQAQAALEARQLDLQTALDEEMAASRAFNSVRGIEQSKVLEKLQSLTGATHSQLKRPSRAPFREDVLAAQQQSRAARAASRLGAEKNLPTFEVYGSFALNARDSSLSSAMAHSLTTERPTLAVGARLIAPLNWEDRATHRAGYAREEAGAELNFQRKVFEQETLWQDLEAKLEEAELRMTLSKKLEQAQKEKLLLERERLSRGRSTTYQVLLFESDYALSQLGRIRAEAEILKIIAQMRTFSGVSS